VTARLPDGYGLVTRRGVEGFALAGALDWLEGTLAREGTLEAWAGHGESMDVAGGRVVVRARAAPVPGPDGRARWVCRHYRRGGWVARVLGDRYAAVGTERPFRELIASVAARARGVRTPAVVAGAAYRAGLVYRADLVTEEVPDAPSLADWLRAPRDRPPVEDLLLRAGRLVGALERARVLHADANAGNVLMAREGPAWVVDLDRAAVLAPDARVPHRMRARLERSLRKICAALGLEVTASAWGALRAGYEEPT
jgi:3-deoxy-D-manno-octulosonic acid kinase